MKLPEGKARTMKLEPTHLKGQYYRTRLGQKVRIYATDGADDYERIHGAVLKEDGWAPFDWFDDGSYNAPGRTAYDIIGPWNEPESAPTQDAPDFCDSEQYAQIVTAIERVVTRIIEDKLNELMTEGDHA